jgi:N-acetylneuraminic acid mutarotase
MKKLYFIAFALVLIIISCSKKDPTPTPPSNGGSGSNGGSNNPTSILAINSFSPASAMVGATVTIKGAAFGTDTSLVSIKFGTMTTGIKPKTISDTLLTVIVPTTAITGKLQVAVGSKTATSATDFTLLKTAPPVPTITSFSPETAKVGDVVTINGTNFGTDTNSVSIKFGTSSAIKPKTLTATTMTVVVPASAQNGKVQISVSGGTIISSTDNFTLNTAFLTITSFSPTTVSAGDTLTINGTFGTTATYLKVYLPMTGTTTLTPVTPVKFSPTQLKVIIPSQQSFSGPVMDKVEVTYNVPNSPSQSSFVNSTNNLTILPTLFLGSLTPTPTSARLGEIIEINGNFSTTDNLNSISVQFTGSTTIVHPLKISIHSNLYIRVPTDAKNGPIRVTETGYGGANTLAFTVLTPLPSIQSGAWTVRPNMGGYDTDGYFGVANSYSFVVNNKVYIGGGGSVGGGFGGSPAWNDLWQFDPQYNAWLQVANFGGGNRTSAVAFAIGSKGYVGSGANETGTPMADFWQYDPDANTWSQIANFTGGARIEAVGFTIGSYGYVGSGYTGSAVTSDFYKYDPSANTWTAIAPIPGAREEAFAFSIGNYGYVGGGTSKDAGTTAGTDLYSYDPSSNTWTAKASIPNYSYASQNSSFVIGTNGYVGLGYNFVNGNPAASNLVFQYNSQTNTWTSLPNFGGTARYSGVGFAVGNVGYFGMGASAFGITANTDYWAYTP